MPAPRRCICCSRCARRSTCCSAEGLENAFQRHRLLGEAVRRAVAVWAEGQVLGFNIAEAGERSNTVTTVTMNGHDPAALQRYCKEKCGVVLGTGIGDLQGQAFRIAHMGHVNAPMILGTLGVIEVASTRSISRTARAEPKPRSSISGRVWGREAPPALVVVPANAGPIPRVMMKTNSIASR